METSDRLAIMKPQQHLIHSLVTVFRHCDSVSRTDVEIMAERIAKIQNYMGTPQDMQVVVDEVLLRKHNYDSQDNDELKQFIRSKITPQ